MGSLAWRPPQWSKPAMVSIIAPLGAQVSSAVVQQTSVGLSQVSAPVFSGPVTYVFDAVLALEHDQTLTKTHHPVQTGASISSHAYIEPAQLVLNVLMSDVAASYVGGAANVQPWSGNPSKSVAAYQQMLTLQAARIPLTVVTRLRTYYNMLILKVSPREDDRTITGARFRIEFEQIFIANTLATPVSARVNDTSSTGLGAVNVQPPSAAVNTQFNIDGLPASPEDASVDVSSMSGFLSTHPSGVNVPGAGTYSSTNTNSLQQLPSPR